MIRRALTALILGAASLMCAVHAEQAARRPAATSLTQLKGATRPVDARGFIRRWLVLEPVPVMGRLTEPAVQEVLQSAPYPGPIGSLPRHGEAVTVANNAVA